MSGKMEDDIIPITPGYTINDILEDLHRMDRVMSSVENIKKYDFSRKEYYTIEKYKFRGINDDHVRARIKRSINHYQKLNDKT